MFLGNLYVLLTFKTFGVCAFACSIATAVTLVQNIPFCACGISRGGDVWRLAESDLPTAFKISSTTIIGNANVATCFHSCAERGVSSNTFAAGAQFSTP